MCFLTDKQHHINKFKKLQQCIWSLSHHLTILRVFLTGHTTNAPTKQFTVEFIYVYDMQKASFQFNRNDTFYLFQERKLLTLPAPIRWTDAFFLFFLQLCPSNHVENRYLWIICHRRVIIFNFLCRPFQRRRKKQNESPDCWLYTYCFQFTSLIARMILFII